MTAVCIRMCSNMLLTNNVAIHWITTGCTCTVVASYPGTLALPDDNAPGYEATGCCYMGGGNMRVTPECRIGCAVTASRLLSSL